MYKPELKKTQNLIRKTKNMYSYIPKYMHDFVSKEMLPIRKFRSFRLENSQLSPQKILTFSFCNIDRLYYEKHLSFDLY